MGKSSTASSTITAALVKEIQRLIGVACYMSLLPLENEDPRYIERRIYEVYHGLDEDGIYDDDDEPPVSMVDRFLRGMSPFQGASVLADWVPNNVHFASLGVRHPNEGQRRYLVPGLVPSSRERTNIALVTICTNTHAQTSDTNRKTAPTAWVLSPNLLQAKAFSKHMDRWPTNISGPNLYNQVLDVLGTCRVAAEHGASFPRQGPLFGTTAARDYLCHVRTRLYQRYLPAGAPHETPPDDWWFHGYMALYLFGSPTADPSLHRRWLIHTRPTARPVAISTPQVASSLTGPIKRKRSATTTLVKEQHHGTLVSHSNQDSVGATLVQEQRHGALVLHHNRDSESTKHETRVTTTISPKPVTLDDAAARLSHRATSRHTVDSVTLDPPTTLSKVPRDPISPRSRAKMTARSASIVQLLEVLERPQPVGHTVSTTEPVPSTIGIPKKLDTGSNDVEALKRIATQIHDETSLTSLRMEPQIRALQHWHVAIHTNTDPKKTPFLRTEQAKVRRELQSLHAEQRNKRQRLDKEYDVVLDRLIKTIGISEPTTLSATTTRISMSPSATELEAFDSCTNDSFRLLDTDGTNDAYFSVAEMKALDDIEIVRM